MSRRYWIEAVVAWYNWDEGKIIEDYCQIAVEEWMTPDEILGRLQQFRRTLFDWTVTMHSEWEEREEIQNGEYLLHTYQHVKMMHKYADETWERIHNGVGGKGEIT